MASEPDYSKGRGTKLGTEYTLAALYGDGYELSRVIRKAGSDLRDLREGSGVTQRELCEMIGTNQMQIYNVEGGRKLGMQLKSIIQYAEALGYRTVISFEPVESDSDPT